MSVTIALFLSLLQNMIDKLAKADPKIRAAADILQAHEQLALFRELVSEFERLPKLLAEKAKAKALLKSRTEKIEALVRSESNKDLAVAIRKLVRRIKINRECIEESHQRIRKLAHGTPERQTLCDANNERRETVRELRAEIRVMVQGYKERMKNPTGELRRLQMLQRQSATRIANLEKEIALLDRPKKDVEKNLEAMIKLARKATNWIVNRQAHVDAELAKAQAAANAVAEPASNETVPAVPNDDDIHRWAREHQLPIASADDLEAARELYAVA